MDLDILVTLAEQDSIPVVRTDFSDDAAWEAVIAAVTAPSNFGEELPEDAMDDGYVPNLVPVVDRSFAGATAELIAAAYLPRGVQVAYLLLADAQSMAEAGQGQDPTLVWLDLSALDEDDEDQDDEDYGRAFRCVISEVASIEVNLSIGNMDFHEFADYADEHGGGTFRGFAEGD